jgi:hypothetical protein
MSRLQLVDPLPRDAVTRGQGFQRCRLIAIGEAAGQEDGTLAFPQDFAGQFDHATPSLRMVETEDDIVLGRRGIITQRGFQAGRRVGAVAVVVQADHAASQQAQAACDLLAGHADPLADPLMQFVLGWLDTIPYTTHASVSG